MASFSLVSFPHSRLDPSRPGRYTSRHMRVLYIAEIVSKPGIYCVKSSLDALREEKSIDFVIANGDGATGGFGIGKNHAGYLRKLGVDVITGGDQTFYKKDMIDHLDNVGYMLRPANIPSDSPGRGWRHFTVQRYQEDPTGPQLPPVKVGVLSLVGQSGFTRYHGNNPFAYLSNVTERMRKQSNIIIVDFHAMTTAEKQSMFFHADGEVTAVIGSGQRVQTADERVMTGGTAVICDAGRTGSVNSVAGLAPDVEVSIHMTQIPRRSQDVWARLELQGVLLEIDEANGWVHSFERINRSVDTPDRSERGD